FWTPKTSCRPAATRNSTAAWKTPPSTMLRLCAIRAPEASHAPRVDPVVEPGAARLLDLLRGHHLHGIDRHEVVAVLVGGDALVVARLLDVFLRVPGRAGQGLHLDALERPARRLGCGLLPAG